MRIITALGAVLLIVGFFSTLISVSATFQCLGGYNSRTHQVIGCGFFPLEPQFIFGIGMLAAGVVLILIGENKLELFREVTRDAEESPVSTET